jgi:hypothetical protein
MALLAIVEQDGMLRRLLLCPLIFFPHVRKIAPRFSDYHGNSPRRFQVGPHLKYKDAVTIELTCGDQKREPVAVEVVEGVDERFGTAGKVRLLELR